MLLLINRVTQSVGGQNARSPAFHNWVSSIDAWKLQSRVSDWRLTDKCAPPCVAELWPAAVCEEQRGRAGVVQFERRPGGFPPSDRWPGEMASAAAAGTESLWHHCDSYINLVSFSFQSLVILTVLHALNEQMSYLNSYSLMAYVSLSTTLVQTKASTTIE